MNKIILPLLLITFLGSCGFSQKQNFEENKSTLLYENNNEFTQSKIEIYLLEKEKIECDSINKIQIIDSKNSQFGFRITSGKIELKDSKKGIYIITPFCRNGLKTEVYLTLSVYTEEGEIPIEKIKL